jgi:type II secretory pathway pseudopilin PulG
MNTKSKGFTLLEILVASTILFSSVVALALIYKTSFMASEKAVSKIQQSSVIRALLAEIQSDVRHRTTKEVNALNGSGTIWGLDYSWQAEVQEIRSPADKFDYDFGEFTSYPERYKLWMVTVNLQDGGAINRFQYNELSWF